MNEQSAVPDGPYVITTKSAEFDAFYAQVRRAMTLSRRLGDLGVDDDAMIRSVFSELTGKPVVDSFRLFTPFLADYGLNITVGERTVVNHDCMFLGHGAITIGDRVLVGPRVTLTTAGHPVEPERRRDYIDAEPITIESDVWIGAAATIVPGVTIGHDSVVAAGAVVTRDVPPRTLVGGNPATVIREL